MLRKGIKVLLIVGLVLGVFILHVVTKGTKIVLADSGTLQKRESRVIPYAEFKHPEASQNTWYEGGQILMMNGEVVICLDPTTYAHEIGYTGQAFADTEELATSSGRRYKIDRELQKKLGFITYYGYTEQPTDLNYHFTTWIGYELLGWDIQTVRGGATMEQYQAFKAEVMAKVHGYKNSPSWTDITRTIKVGESITLIDDNNVVQNLVIPHEINGFTTSLNGNHLTLTATKDAVDGQVRLQQERNGGIHGLSVIYRANGSQTVAKFKIKDPQSATLNLNVIKNGTIKIVKTDHDTGQPLSDVEFTLYDKGSTVPLQTGVTNAQGIVEFTEVEAKAFDIKETRARDNYRLNNHVYAVTVPAGETVSVNATNVIKKMRVSVSKHLDEALDGSGTRVAGAGITFDIVSLNTNQVVASMTTDESGYAITEPFRQEDDRYQLVEHAPEGYKPAEPIMIEPTGEDGKVYHYIVENNVKQSYLNIVKGDEETGETIQASGVAFQLYKDGQLVSQQVTYPSVKMIDTFVTDDNGQVTLPQPLAYGTYTLKEVQAPTGYVLSDKPLTFEITGEDITVTVRFNNAPQKGMIEVEKKGQVLTDWVKQDNGVHVPVYHEQLIGGATFQFTNVDNGNVFHLTTQAGQVLRTDALPLGSYDVVELSAPKGYIKDSKVYRVHLTPQAQTVRLAIESLSVYNERKTLTVPVKKVFEESDDFTHEQSATIGLYTKQDYTENGVTLPKHSLVGYAVVNGNQRVTFTNLPSELVTYAKELSTSEAYTLNEQAFDVTVSEKDTATANTIVIENALKRGSQELIKVDASSKQVVAGATFRLVAVLDDQTEKEVGTYTTDNTGKIVFDHLEKGHYFAQETSTLPHYFLNLTKFFFEITGEANDVNAVITVENERMPSIVTEATSQTGGKVVYTHEKIKEVAVFNDLMPGKEYTTVAKLFTSTGEVLTSQTRTFVATGIQHSEVFLFDVPVGHYGNTVFGEELFREGEKIAVHVDLTNKNQTVKVLEPKINTFAKVGGTKEMRVGERHELVDTLTYTDFKQGKVLVKTWVVKYGTDESVGEAIEHVLELDGAGEVTIPLDHIDTSTLPAGKYTVMEQVFDVIEKDGKIEKGKLISEHVDNTDENQSFTVTQALLPYTGSEHVNYSCIIGFSLGFGLGHIGRLVWHRVRQKEKE